MKKVYPVIIISFIAIFLFQAIKLVQTNPQIHLYSDWPGHLDKANKLDWPWKSGWDTTFWGGYPTLTYPCLAHLILKLFSQIIPLEKHVILASCLTVFILQIIGVIQLSKKLIPQKKSLQTLLIITLIMILYYEPGDLLGSFTGTLVTGGFPSALGLCFLLFYMASSNPYLKAVYIGLTLLTHTLTGFFVFVLAGLELALLILKHIRHRHRLNKLDFIPIIGGFIIGSPWILAYLDPAFKGVAINMAGDLFSLTTPLTIISISLLLEFSVFEPILIALVFASLLTLLPYPVTTWLQTHGLNGIHFYRFHLILLIVVAASLFRLFALKKKGDIKIWVFYSLVIIASLFLLKDPFGPSSTHFSYNLNLPIVSTSRIMDVSGTNTTGNYMRAAEHLLTQSGSLVGTNGLFYESSPHGPLYYSLATQLNPNFFANGTLSSFFSDYATSSAKLNVAEATSTLGINYISYFSSTMFDFGQSTATIGAITFTDPDKKLDYPVSINWYLSQVNTESLIQTLAVLPQVDPKINLGSWWFDQPNHPRVVRQILPSLPIINLHQPDITQIQISPTKISFNVDSDIPAPVIIKFTHNKYWKNISNASNPPIWITPGHMLLFATGQTKLVWTPPPYLTPAWILSLFTIGYCLCQNKNSPPTKVGGPIQKSNKK